MAYRNKTYIAFDGDTDIKYYDLMKARNANDGIDFNFFDAHQLQQCRDSSKEETIKRSLLERLNNSKMFILLIGEHTKHLTKFVKWEVEHAMKLNLPIICVNINGSRKLDERDPSSWFNDYLRVYVPFLKEPINWAIEIFEDGKYEEYKKKHPNHTAINFTAEYYKKRGL